MLLDECHFLISQTVEQQLVEAGRMGNGMGGAIP